MIRLKNVSKFYYSKGLIASGISKVNLDLKRGEFLVITGESGSGKSTLLNVISGLDSYEEGEMYIHGEETSHYTSADFEEYRKKHIGNIFQHFNLINSYTVYQNVELILLINGTPKEERKSIIPQIIEKVGLTEYTKTKVSKLSGGQKQRVSIARALAKNTSIIVADEPTGNLDSQSAQGIVQLLADIAQDKLVVVVTHNFDQFKDYATRVVKMHDGKVVEDSLIQPPTVSDGEGICNGGSIAQSSKIRLGVRNTFNVLPKFLLLLLVFGFVVFAVTSQYTSFKKQDAEFEKLGYNNVFLNYSDQRIVFAKGDKSPITREDDKEIEKMPNVETVVEEDILLDAFVDLENENILFTGFPYGEETLDGELDFGTLPQADNEVVLAGDKRAYYFAGNPEEMVGQEVKLTSGENYTTKVKVVGIQFIETRGMSPYMDAGLIYGRESLLNQLRYVAYEQYTEIKTTINGKKYLSYAGSPQYRITPSEKVESGKAIVSEEVNYLYDQGNSLSQKITVTGKNLYYEESLNLEIGGTYNKSTMKSQTGEKDYENNKGRIYINEDDYRKLFNKGNYQSTIMVKDADKADETVKALEEKGYKAIALNGTLVPYFDTDIMDIVQVPLAVFMIVIMFFVSYFVIQLILRSRKSYFSIVRMLGLGKGATKRILDIELFAIVNIAYALFLILVALVYRGVINIDYILELTDYLRLGDYITLYGILVVLMFLISTKFANKLFKKSAMESYRGEAS